MASYCESAPGHPLHGPYHDREYGFPISDDNQLLERLVLELNQAGLSWLTILKKRQHFRDAFDGFVVSKVARYGDTERSQLLNDAGIIRNRLKIDAAIFNARRVIELQQQHGSFNRWLLDHHPRSKLDWVKLFKQTFHFTGGEITGEFLMSIGILPGAHHTSCPVYQEILKLNPPWSW